jgi:uncharacterized protein YgiM (DUF1202 family)
MIRNRLLQIALGVLLGSLFMVGTISTLGYLLWSRFTISPARPTFAEENKPRITPTPIAKSSSEPSPTPVPTKTAEDLPKGSYKATVIRPNGVSLRSGPSRKNDRLGGVGYNENVVVLEKSQDGEWSKIRSSASGAEGWVRSGNLSQQ